MDWWGPVLYEYYGSTESAIAFSIKPHDWLEQPGTVGRPVSGLRGAGSSTRTVRSCPRASPA